MTSLVQSYGTSFGFSGNFRLLFQTTDNTIDRIQKILFSYKFFAMASCDQSSFITNVCNIRTGESRSLTSQQVYIDCIIYLYRA